MRWDVRNLLVRGSLLAIRMDLNYRPLLHFQFRRIPPPRQRYDSQPIITTRFRA